MLKQTAYFLERALANFSTTDLSGVEHEHNSAAPVPIGGKLPHYLELRTSLVLDCLQVLVPKAAGSKNRKRLGTSLASRARIGMYLELNEKLHLAYADQRDGRQHQQREHAFRDYAKERVLLKERIATARFPAQDCLSLPAAVVAEFLHLFSV